jgi:hypothetical protein
LLSAQAGSKPSSIILVPGEIMNRTLVASAIALAFTMAGSAWADQTITKTGDGSDTFTDTTTTTITPINTGAAANNNSTATQNTAGTAAALAAGSAAANNGGTASATLTNAFNTNNVINSSTLSGTVAGVTVVGIGNSAVNLGTTVGGPGAAGTGVGGVAAATNGQTSGAATSGNTAVEGGAIAANGAGGAGTAAPAAGGDANTATATGGASSGTATATGGTAYTGDAYAKSGRNEATATASAGDGNGTGGAGGAGGKIHVDAGSFNMSNTMTSTGQSAAGIMVASQNSGAAALVQNSVNVQSNLSVGH